MPFSTTHAVWENLRESAINEQGKRVFVRSQSGAHDGHIKPTFQATKDQQDIIDLLGNVFSHHEIASFLRINRQEVRLDLPESISKLFHFKYFVPPRIVRGDSPGNALLTSEEFFDRIAIKDLKNQTNNIQFMVGPIGSGKTTFICNLIYIRLNAFQARNIIPVRFNLDSLFEHNIPQLSDVFRVLKGQLIAALELNKFLPKQDIEYIIRNTRTLGENNEEAFARSLAHTIDIIRDKLKKGLTFFIDNIDYLYHLTDRGVFAKSAHSDRVAAFEAIIALVRIFSKIDQPCANRGITVVYCVRRDTLEFMRSKVLEIPLQVELSDISAYFGHENVQREVRHAATVIEKRFEMLNDLAQDIPQTTKRDEVVKQSKRLLAHYGELVDPSNRSGDPLNRMQHMWRLSRRGLRDFLEQLKQYSWIEYQNTDRISITDRFLHSYSPSIISYMLGGRRRYAQFSGDVPNLYLINALAPSNERGVAEEFKRPHFVTYWLKRMILEYLAKTENRFQSIDEIVRVFAGANGRGYPDPLVRYLLGNLAEVPKSECIEAELGASGAAGNQFFVQKVHVTRRAKFLLENFAESFTYIQLILDDWRMRLPIEFEELYEFRNDDEDYSYLVASPETYGLRLTKLLQKKVPQVLHFSIMLEESLNFERVIYPRVYQRLMNVGVKIDRTDLIVSRVVEEIDKLTSRMRQHRGEIYERNCNRERLARLRLDIRQKLGKIFGIHTDLHALCYDG